jgi:hypothetical protein
LLHPIALAATLVTATAALGACTQAAEVTEGRNQPVFQGIDAILLDEDLVRFSVAMTGAQDNADVEAYGRCAAAQYTLDRGYGFARHVRTIVTRDGRNWSGDAVYLISAALPEGFRTIDAKVAAAECEDLGIPTV